MRASETWVNSKKSEEEMQVAEMRCCVAYRAMNDQIEKVAGKLEKNWIVRH